MRATVLLLALATTLSACAERSRELVVMTRNLYLGMAAESIIGAPAAQIPLAAARGWEHLQRTNFPERAGRLAAEILAANPHVVGLQEIPVYRVQTPGDAAAGGTTPATQVAFDFLPILLDTLAAHGARYDVAALDRTTDVEVPAVTGQDARGNPTFTDVRYTDGDALLVRADVPHAQQRTGVYTATVPLHLGGQSLAITRGWGSIEATVGGAAILFVNTHLEDFSVAVQVGQAAELLAMLQGEARPVVLLGDFNSDAIHNATPTYRTLLGAGFADAWPLAHPGEPGATCCNSELLNTPTATYDQRLDLVLFRDGRDRRFRGAPRASLVGTQPAERTKGGLWPSDHAGLVVKLPMPK